MKYLVLIRYQNLLMLALMQWLFRFGGFDGIGFLKNHNNQLALNDFQYYLLIMATVCIAAGGYIINNIHDVETDLKNKPHQVVVGIAIKENLAYNLYFLCTIIGVLIGFYISNIVNKPNLAIIFIIISSLLYFYTTNLKQSLIIGNILTAFVLSMSVIIIGIFNLYPIINNNNIILMKILFSIIFDYAIFTFIINFIREIIKDIEDIEGDREQDMQTIPIYFGISITLKLVFMLFIISILMIIYYIYNYLYENNLFYATFYGLMTILAPLLYAAIKTSFAKNKQDYSHLSWVLKWLLLFGIGSIAIITLNIQQNA
ncbi:prenyltransferase [Flavobacterium branchiophilum]|uniref:4-hydroxybenzoate polyprenyltransferase n=1 Tax=Flavobacterium branchiophilum TaxID=55197 RepID=A0A543G7Y1_9FLAO|nr:geranylgeranylglycerol-phosphate geranylgeranyltransferase [Flavobacterium branchiophilum]OXA76942.1 prenyltransferase [Flavobacterium branchiophilum] [Flavobacterium branchiophilum NBRC 15030 = ATCC 35035]TQM42199.1 4-hydroxybenzoate polyprenyltransferase [Flavobacterium branchiophilum]GEM54506.1 prenyltransferase [Flavobacterium branchiophilum NBRC 15030 = ATCC 35035]